MADETLTPEAPFDPENVRRYNFNAGMGAHEYPEGVIVRAADYDALLAFYRTLQSENRIAMRALEMACSYHRGERSRSIGQPEIAAAWLAEARGGEGR